MSARMSSRKAMRTRRADTIWAGLWGRMGPAKRSVMTSTAFEFPEDFFDFEGERPESWPDHPEVRRAVAWLRDLVTGLGAPNIAALIAQFTQVADVEPAATPARRRPERATKKAK